MTDKAIGKPVLDIDNVLLGTVGAVEGNYYRVTEGPLATFFLLRTHAKVEEHKVFLVKGVTDLFEGLQVYDNKGTLLGVVEEVLAPDKDLDCFIIRTLGDEFVFVTPEDIHRIDSKITLETDSGEVAFENRSHGFGEKFAHVLKRLKEGRL